jgi:hypothetical protein
VPKTIRVSDPDGAPRSEPQLRGLNESDRDLETVPKRRRRVFSAADKLRIVKEAGRCLASGERGALGAMAERLDAQLLERNAELERKLHIANVLMALQKKRTSLLGVALPESDEDS